MTRPVLVALAASSIALAAAGCGSSSKANSSTTSTSTPTTAVSSTPASSASVTVASGTPLSHSVWITKGDAICARLNAQLASSIIRTMADFKNILPQDVAYERVALGQLAQLVPPAAQAHDWQSLLSNVQGWASASEKLSREMQSSTFKPKSSMFNAAGAYHEAFARISKHDGFRKCSVT